MKTARLTEKAFQAQVVELAVRLGWLCYHTYDSRRCVRGFPDLVLVRERVVWAELKIPPNKATPDQRRWINGLVMAGAEVYTWVPGEWDEIKSVLGGV